MGNADPADARWIDDLLRYEELRVNVDDLVLTPEQWRKAARAAARKAGVRIMTGWLGDNTLVAALRRPPKNPIAEAAFRQGLEDLHAAQMARAQGQDVPMPVSSNWADRVDAEYRKQICAVPDPPADSEKDGEQRAD